MKQLLYCLCLLLILSNFSFAQSESLTSNDKWKKTVYRSVLLDEPINAVLKSLYTETDSNIHLFDALINAITKNEITAYTDATWRFSLSAAQIQQMLIDTKDTTSITYSPTTINELLIHENWHFDRYTAKLSTEHTAFAPVIRKLNDTSKYYPIFRVKQPDFEKFCQKYYIIPLNETQKVPLNKYFKMRSFKSRIIKVFYPDGREDLQSIIYRRK